MTEEQRTLAEATDELMKRLVEILDNSVRYGHPAERGWHERTRNVASKLDPWAARMVAERWLNAGFKHLPRLGANE